MICNRGNEDHLQPVNYQLFLHDHVLEILVEFGDNDFDAVLTRILALARDMRNQGDFCLKQFRNDVLRIAVTHFSMDEDGFVNHIKSILETLHITPPPFR